MSTITYTPNADGVTFTGSDGQQYIQNQQTGAYTVAGTASNSSSSAATTNTVTINGVQYTDNGDGTYLDVVGATWQKNTDGTMSKVVSTPAPTASAETAALANLAPEATISDAAAGPATTVVPPAGTQITINTNNTIVFTDADATNNGSNPDTNAQIHIATILISTTTVDANTTVKTIETLPQGTIDNPTVVITTTVTTSDPNTVVAINSNLTSEAMTVTPTNTEGVDPATGLTVIVLTATVTFTHPAITTFFESTTNSTLTKPPVEPEFRYLIMPQHLVIDNVVSGQSDPNMTCDMLHSMFNVGLFKVSEVMYHTLRTGWDKAEVIETDADTAKYGVMFFGEIRPVAKLYEAGSSQYPATKTPIAITQDIVDKILFIMKSFATEIIESEYERRYLTARGASDFEADTWTIQREEAKAFNANPNADTPFLDDLVELEGITKAELVTKILEEQAVYYKTISTMLVQMKGLIAKFNACITVWDINILYEDYFGIAMPISEAIALDRMVSSTDWTRKPGYEVKGNGYYF
jgi:hypothetical protein